MNKIENLLRCFPLNNKTIFFSTKKKSKGSFSVVTSTNYVSLIQNNGIIGELLGNGLSKTIKVPINSSNANERIFGIYSDGDIFSLCLENKKIKNIYINSTSLKVLILDNNPELSSENFYNILYNIPNLEFLSIRNCNQIDTSNLKNFKKIKHIQL